MSASARYLQLLDEMKESHIRKNAGYAGADNPDPWANFRMAEQFGIKASVGAAIRRGDKYIRSVNLLRDPDNEKVGESRKDTLMDEAAYALIEICLMEEEELPRLRELSDTDEQVFIGDEVERKRPKAADPWVCCPFMCVACGVNQNHVNDCFTNCSGCETYTGEPKR